MTILSSLGILTTMEKLTSEKYTVKWTHKIDSEKMDTFEFKADKIFNLAEILEPEVFEDTPSRILMNISIEGQKEKTYEIIGDGERAEATLFEDNVTFLIGRSLVTINLLSDEVEGKARLGGLRTGGHTCSGCGGCGGK